MATTETTGYPESETKASEETSIAKENNGPSQRDDQRPEGGATPGFSTTSSDDGPGCPTGTAAEINPSLQCETSRLTGDTSSEENWEKDISPGQPGYVPSGHVHFERAHHKSHRTRRRMYREQAEEFKRREAERIMAEAAQAFPEEDSEGRPSGSNIVPVPVEEIEARIPWCVDFPPLRRSDAPCGTTYPYAQGVGPVPAMPGWAPFTVAGEPVPPPPGTLIWVPYGPQGDPHNSAMMPGHPAPGNQFVAMEVPAMGMHGPGAGGEAMVPPYGVPGAAAPSSSPPQAEDGARRYKDVQEIDAAGKGPAVSAPAVFPQGPPEAERSHYMPAAGPVWMGPNVDMAYGHPIASHQVPPPVFWMANAPPPFGHAGIAAFEQQPAPEEQAGAQLSEDAGAYAGVPREASPASGAMEGEKLGENIEAVPEISTTAGPPPEITAEDEQSTVPPEPASDDRIAPPQQPATTVAAQPAERIPEVLAAARRAEEDGVVAAFLLAEWKKAKRAGRGSYYEPAKARRGRRAR